MTDGVIKLVTATERAEKEEREYREAVRLEALGMLKRAADMVHERGISGIAIALVFDDGTFGRLLPTVTTSMAALIGSLGVAHQDLMLKTLMPDD